MSSASVATHSHTEGHDTTMPRLTIDQLLAMAAAHVASGEWISVRELLAEHSDMVFNHPELATLRAQAELRTGSPRHAQACIVAVLPLIQRSGDRRALRTLLNLRAVAELECGALLEAER